MYIATQSDAACPVARPASLAAALSVCTSRRVYDGGHADQFLAEDRETLTVTMRAATTPRSASQTLLSPRHHDSPSDYSAVPK